MEHEALSANARRTAGSVIEIYNEELRTRHKCADRHRDEEFVSRWKSAARELIYLIADDASVDLRAATKPQFASIIRTVCFADCSHLYDRAQRCPDYLNSEDRRGIVALAWRLLREAVGEPIPRNLDFADVVRCPA